MLDESSVDNFHSFSFVEVSSPLSSRFLVLLLTLVLDVLSALVEFSEFSFDKSAKVSFVSVLFIEERTSVLSMVEFAFDSMIEKDEFCKVELDTTEEVTSSVISEVNRAVSVVVVVVLVVGLMIGFTVKSA